MSYILGISGPTSAGKSHFTDSLVSSCEIFGIKFSRISTDDFYKDHADLTFEERSHLNFDDPSAISKEEFLDAITNLRNGIDIKVPVYDFTAHRRTGETRLVESLDLIIVEGIFAFSFQLINSLYNLKIYIKLDSDLRVIRRIIRDSHERGRSLESIISQYVDTIRPTQTKYVEKDEELVDMVLHGDADHSNVIKIIVGYIKCKSNLDFA